MSDITLDFSDGNRLIVHDRFAEPWKVTLVDTGLHTMTGGRIKRIRKFIDSEPFMMTYGDGVSDVNLRELAEFHRSHGKIATMTTVSVSQRFGVIEVDERNIVQSFREKATDDASIINAGFMVLNYEIFDYIADGDGVVFEKEPLEALTGDRELAAYRHNGFWQCMDTQREKNKLEEIWAGGQAPWRIW
jgi:glucose-1-phosphate cytidylyltransferase